ncbi:MAG: hypothetical protein NWF04_00110 [Candidatus Bathyarchaeota archaeon]|nr:hypothetical protein [Candidatus Bathyarchaeota archaeon]
MIKWSLTAKALILIMICCFFTYALYWAAKTIPWMIDITLHPESFYPAAGLQQVNSYSLAVSYVMEYAGFFGLLIRLVAAAFAVLAFAAIQKTGNPLIGPAKNRISKALLLEGIYFLSFIPSIYYLAGFSSLPITSRLCLIGTLGVQIALISPVLILLSRRLKKTSSAAPENSASLVRLTVLACLCYVVAIWFMYIFKWTEMAALEGAIWLIIPPRLIAFSNTAITLTLSAAFAALATKTYLHHKTLTPKTLKLWGASAILLSLHTIIFVIFCFNVNAAYLASFGELWLIPLLGVGVYLLAKNR